MPRKARASGGDGRRNRSPRKSPSARLQHEHLIAWGLGQEARGVNRLLIMMAMEAVQVGSFQTELLDLLTSGELAKRPFVTPPQVWVHLYRRPDHLFGFLGDRLAAICPSEESEASIMGLGTAARWLSFSSRRLHRQAPQEIEHDLWELLACEEFQKNWESCRLAQLQAWNEFLAGLRQDDEGLKDDQFPYDSPEFRFFVEVWWPCWALYGQGAQELFREAEAGNVEAMEKLVCLDKRVLQIPSICQWLTRWQATGKHDVMQIVGTALGATASLKSSVVEQKFRTMTLLWQLSQRLMIVPHVKLVRFRWKDLRDLFDAAAKDQGKICDDDLPASEEALRKARQRMEKTQRLEAWDIFPKKSVP